LINLTQKSSCCKKLAVETILRWNKTSKLHNATYAFYLHHPGQAVISGRQATGHPCALHYATYQTKSRKFN
jgi:hypothetical protein